MKQIVFFFILYRQGLLRCQLEKKNENTQMKSNKGTHKETQQEICSRYTHVYN